MRRPKPRIRTSLVPIPSGMPPRSAWDDRQRLGNARGDFVFGRRQSKEPNCSLNHFVDIAAAAVGFCDVLSQGLESKHAELFGKGSTVKLFEGPNCADDLSVFVAVASGSTTVTERSTAPNDRDHPEARYSLIQRSYSTLLAIVPCGPN